MSLRRNKAVFLDIDGTLISGGGDPFKEDIQAMEEAAGKGQLIFLNTGRSFANIPAILLEFSFLKGIAAGGGAHILLASSPADPRYQTIYHQWVPDDTLAKIFAWYIKQSRCCILEGERDCYVINSFPPLSMAKSPISVNSFDDFKRKSSGDLITKITLNGFAPEDECQLLEPYFTMNCFSAYSEAIIKGNDKGKAMELILYRLGIEQEDSIAIGDSANDLDMIRYAGLGIAMGNASAELKAAAGAITGDCGKGGVAGALRKFVLQ